MTQVVLEVKGGKDLQFIVELARRLNIPYYTTQNPDVISEEERQERMNVWQQFKGILKDTTGYEPSPAEWYEQ